MIDPWLSPGHMLQVPGGLFRVVVDPSMAPNEAELRGPRGQVVRLINIAPPEHPRAIDEADRP